MNTAEKYFVSEQKGKVNFTRDADFGIHYREDEPPLRAELFGVVQMEEHGRILAGSHVLNQGKFRDRLLARLAENEIVLADVCNLMTLAVKEGRQITPAAEWLLDNFYLIEEQIQTANRHLPKGYSKELPRLKSGTTAGHPRVYDIALQTISHGDGRIDPEGLTRFVAAYQEVTALTLGELWAIPIMLRLALIENLRRVAVRLAVGRINSNLADTWADQMIETAEKDPGKLFLLVADMARSDPPLVGSFVAELARRLQGQGPALTLPLTWIAPRLSEIGLTVEQMIQMESQQQAADQVSISNSIGSLRLLGKMNWQEFVEALSVVEKTLSGDPEQSYSRMDFATRDHYRHVIERIGKHSGLPEVDIAIHAIHLATSSAAMSGVHDRTAHVGFYLFGEGLKKLELATATRHSRVEYCRRFFGCRPLLSYVGAISLLTLSMTFGAIAKADADGMPDWKIWLAGLLTLLCASQLSSSLVNWLASLLIAPVQLPRMDFSKGIDPACRTLVTVPSMIVDPDNIARLCEELEIRFLANRDDNIRFSLLTDFADAKSETTEGDAALILQASQSILQLNKKYADAQGDKFFLFHRSRRWNPQEMVWMGHERKRGKLSDLNAFLRGSAAQVFSCVAGDTSVLVDVRYVITLDTDTRLPRDSARKFVAAMSHPLNRPQFDAGEVCISHGYGILQPRIAPSLPGAGQSAYQRLFSGESGIDPYTRASSDMYQDVFSEGSFIGKGIYDIDAFERSSASKLPENRILSHDLLEGCYARSGLLSDVHLYEEYPAQYSADVKRRHRWIRGDWQLIAWVMPLLSAESSGGARQKNPLSALSRWKIFDNLRRSLISASLTLLLLFGWVASPTPWFWNWVVTGVLLIPCLASSLIDILRKSNEISPMQHLRSTLHSIQQYFSQTMVTVAFLPYEAFFSIDAIARALWRVLVSHRRMLEWTPSTEISAGRADDLLASYREMWVAPATAVTTIIVLLSVNLTALGAAAPFLLAWLFAPAISSKISRPRASKKVQLNIAQTIFLHRLARKIWAFYETFMGPDENWLPPDNIQEKPIPAVAHRTSPTNIGLALLANLSAYDFGYISIEQLLKRTANTFNAMASLERLRGHFYNWYDTQNLKPLLPKYISTVDSGNLAGHLLTLRPGLLNLIDQKIICPTVISGIDDTFRILRDLARGTSQIPLLKFQSHLVAANLATLSTSHACLQRLAFCADALASEVRPVSDDQLHWWSQALARQCRDAYDELIYLAPWSSQGNAIYGAELDAIPTLRALAELSARRQLPGNDLLDGDADSQRDRLREELDISIAQGSARAMLRIQEIERLILQATEFSQMDCDFLYDKNTHLMSIGYAVAEQRCDLSYYDLLASEARLCAFVLIAQGQLPQASWFALGRQLTIAGGEPILMSWSGSMFEYLMPLLVMPNYEDTLLSQTYRSVVRRQIEYGTLRRVPWGISESGYHAFDAALNYQYRAFGVPGLGLKRGLGDDLVVAPYASMLAMMVAPEEACVNLQRLADDGFEGKFGLYEAIDYTPSRLPRAQSFAIIQSFMAHHQGMGLLSLACHLLGQPMQKRFESDPQFQATTLLLQERVPKATASYSNLTEIADIKTNTAQQQMPTRIFNRVDTRAPEIQLLSNGRYHLMITNAGGSCSRWKDLALTRWREDGTCDNWGAFCYVRDVASGAFWSTAYQPTLAVPDSYEVIFSEGRAEFRRRDFDIDMHTEIVVSPEDDIEIRRTHLTNRSRVRRTLDFTSYSEIVLAPPAADAAHPAFSNLFVQTEILPNEHAVVCTRRPRSSDEKAPWLLNLMATHGADIKQTSFETDRAQFIGRGNNAMDPRAMRNTAPLSGTQGSVLDPIAAIRVRIELEPGQTAIIDFVIGATETRDEAMHLIAKYQDRYLADRVFELAWTHSQVVLRQLNAVEADAQLYARLAGSIIYANDQLRSEAGILVKNRRGQSGLWSYAISGDLPIVLLQIKNIENIDLVRQTVQAHAYWRLKGLAVDLVIWNEDHAGYRQVLQEQIMDLIASGIEAHAIGRPGGIFVRLAEQVPNEDRILLQSVARIALCDSRGSLAEQVGRRGPSEMRMPKLMPTRPRPGAKPITTESDAEKLQMFNGLGGFAADGREYVITTSAGNTTPAPWVNVMANPKFGTVISESGQAYTWGENAHEFRLTPWNNDSVSDNSGEAFYLRDEESGHYWSPTPLPCRGSGNYTSRHGFGYSIFKHTEDGIRSELRVYVAMDASIKYSVLKVRNESDSERKLSATGYVEWVLGDLRQKTALHIVTETDPVSGALFAHNSYNAEFAERIAFFDVDAANRSISGDRAEFIGRNGSLRHPAAMQRVRLSGRVGAGLDPCAAFQVPIDLAPGQEREIVFMLGVGGRRGADVSSLVRRYRGAIAARYAREEVDRYWRGTLGAVQVDTPDIALNLLANGWLMYQTIACRLWARSGFYQSGGAYGFRDQLQDVMAMIHTEPHLVREHLLLCASHQFVEGDVQHWWHSPSDRGVRTHCSDDLLWLPLATCRYVIGTGDSGVLNESVSFLEGRAVNVDEDSYYDLPIRSAITGTLYEHCARAILKSLRFGSHGLPLIGSCDWNDGMDKVGAKGKGESVWLAFFLYEVLLCFAEISILHQEHAFAERCRDEAEKLHLKIEENGWDGNWYRRAYFDDGTPLGSMLNQECQIDSISQSWSVLSGAGEPLRSMKAMKEVGRRLILRESKLVQLLSPPFDTSTLNPGYIKGYVPGVRENGGQYTHAAVWTAMAFAKMGDATSAWEVMQLINPINHGKTASQVSIYKVEPYVLAADVYAAPGHVGRGGWTWYTGSSGWMYRLIIESLLGLHLENNVLKFTPCLPDDWNSFKLDYRFRSAIYHINVIRANAEIETQGQHQDGTEQSNGCIHLLDDQAEHTVEVRINPSS